MSAETVRRVLIVVALLAVVWGVSATLHNLDDMFGSSSHSAPRR